MDLIVDLHKLYSIKVSIGSMFFMSAITLIGGFLLGFLMGKES